MKIKRLILNNYKKFARSGDPYEYNFFDIETGEISDVTLITANNGEGKTSLLQAIASVVGGAVIDRFSPSDLNWPGFIYKYLQNGRLPVRINVDLKFEKDEVESIQYFIEELQKIYPDRNYRMPSKQQEIRLYLDYEQDRVYATPESGVDAFYLTKGYQYAKILESKDKAYGKRFEEVGSILWYDEQRTSSSITKYLMKSDDSEATSEVNQNDLIKEIIARWYYTHLDLERGKFQLRAGQFDKFAKLKESYEKIFAGRELRGATLAQGGGNDIDIVFFDGHNEYDFSEMSAGERAIFPMLLDFANMNINNSIVLIDELELHLHPPLQQQFLNALPHLGKNNQFIITTHSPFIASQFPEEKKIVISHEYQDSLSFS